MKKEEEKKEVLNTEQLKQTNGGIDVPTDFITIKKIPSLMVDDIHVDFDMTPNKQSQE